MPGWKKDAQAIRELAVAIEFKPKSREQFAKFYDTWSTPAKPADVPANKEFIDRERQRLATNKMAALAHVNKIRNELRLGSIDELVGGKPNHGQHCVIAASVKAGAQQTYAEVSSQWGQYSRTRWGVRHYRFSRNNPSEVTQFVLDFDRGKYPELVKR